MTAIVAAAGVWNGVEVRRGPRRGSGLSGVNNGLCVCLNCISMTSYPALGSVFIAARPGRFIDAEIQSTKNPVLSMHAIRLRF